MSEADATPTTTAETTTPAPVTRAASRIAARLARASDDVAPPDAESAPDADAASPPGDAADADSASGEPLDETAAGNSPAAPGGNPPPEAPKTEHELLQEKLERARAENRERRERAEARRAREDADRYAEQRRAEADAHAKAMADERAKWERLGKEGTYKDILTELGRDPRAEFEALQREAVEAGTPEAIAKRQAAEWERRFKEAVEPLQKRLEELTQEREHLKQQTAVQSIQSDVHEALRVGGTAYDDLVDANGSELVTEKAVGLARDPDTFYQLARTYGVRLTNARGGYTMTDILNVLAAAQARYDETRNSRRSARTASNPTPAATAAPAAPPAPTVNGTAAPRNAGTQTIGNDLATARAGDGKFVSTAKTAAQRIRERARRA